MCTRAVADRVQSWFEENKKAVGSIAIGLGIVVALSAFIMVAVTLALTHPGAAAHKCDLPNATTTTDTTKEEEGHEEEEKEILDLPEPIEEEIGDSNNKNNNEETIPATHNGGRGLSRQELDVMTIMMLLLAMWL